jgi:uncharacterized membrane protein
VTGGANVLSSGRRRRRRWISWADLAVRFGTVVLVVVVIALVAWAAGDIAH